MFRTDALRSNNDCPSTEPVSIANAQFASEESPSGMLARSGSYAVKSRLIDDDKQVWLDFEWGQSSMLLCDEVMS